MKARHVVILLLVFDIPACGYLLYTRIAFEKAQPDPYWEKIEEEVRFPPDEIDRAIAVKRIDNIVVKRSYYGVGVGIGAPQITLASKEQFLELVPKYERVFVAVDVAREGLRCRCHGRSMVVKRYFATMFGRPEVYVYEKTVSCPAGSYGEFSDDDPPLPVCRSERRIVPERGVSDSWLVRNAFWVCAVQFVMWCILCAGVMSVYEEDKKIKGGAIAKARKDP